MLYKEILTKEFTVGFNIFRNSILKLGVTACKLCSKCDEYAKEWAPVAEELWTTLPHRDTHTQYYRDTEEGKKEFGGCTGNCATCNAHKN